MSLIVHINGWPGCGKLTIARLLAKQLESRLVDNHTLLNPAESLFVRNDPLYQSLRKVVRALVLEHAARLPCEIPIVFTDALADDENDRALFDDYRDLARKRSARLVAVVLACDEAENVRRLTAPGRADLLKLTRVDTLLRLRAKHRLLRPTGVSCIDLDVSTLPAKEAATALYQRCTQAPACQEIR